jgi:DNA-binding transcriptional LysR family regulator
MNLDHLRYFLEAARQEHFGKAAKTLGISRSAVSHGIAQLEEELARELFFRRGRQVIITPEGKHFATKLEVAVSNLSRVKEETFAAGSQLDGNFRLGSTHFLCAEYLTAAWAELQNEHAQLRAEIFSLRSADVVSKVASGELDFGLSVSPQTHPNLEIAPIREGRLLITVRTGHPILRSKSSDRMRQLAEYPAVLPRSLRGIELCDRNHPMFKKYGITPNYDCLVDSYDVAVKKIACSLSWGFLPDWIIEHFTDSVTGLTPAKGWDAPINISAIWPRNRSLSRPMKFLLDKLQSH